MGRSFGAGYVAGRWTRLSPFPRRSTASTPLRPVAGPRTQLTARQRQIVTFIALRKTNAQIGQELSLSPRSVETHRYRLIKKLGLKNSAELFARFALAT